MGQRAGVSFELERLDLEGDELVVTGHWSGVRGLRFVRPTLVAEDRRILATLEHKPWAPALDRTWVAAFPWNGGDPADVDGLTLAVGPQVTVPLGRDTAASDPRLPPAASGPPPPLQEARPAALQAELDELARARACAERDRDRALAELDELARARACAERDRDRALAQLDEAVAAREAAVRTRTRMQQAHDAALRAREDLEAALAAAQAQRDEANAQRDEVLLAYRALQRHVKSERAQEQRAQEQRAQEQRAGAERARADEPEPEEPIGVRTMPAARTVMAELQRPRPANKLPFSIFDLWVIRVLGTVAAACFILLLISILRVFI